MSGKKRVLLLLAPGYEELEAVTVVDILRRAGVEVVMAGLEEGPVSSAREVKIIPDATLDEVVEEDFDLIVLPGGLDGTERLAGDKRVNTLLKKQLEKGRAVGAICAAPTLLDRAGLASGKRLTCHPICQKDIKDAALEGERVVQDGILITSQAPGTAMEFAFKLVEFLEGPKRVEEVNKGVLAKL